MSLISEEMRLSLERNGGIRQAFNEAARQRKLYGADNVYDLSLGNPSALPPVKVQEMIKMLSDDENLSHQYMCEAGYEEVRSAVAASLNISQGTSYGCENIIMTNGVSGGINIVLRTLLDPGDEVVIFKPYYPAYVGFIKNWAGKVVTVDPDEESFQPDFKELAEKITERTKAVIVNSPHNPTGIIYTMDTAEKLADVLEKKQEEYGHSICLLSDEPYRDLIYDGTKLPWWPKVYRNTIVSYSFSKSLSLAGERIGYLLIPSEVTKSSEVIAAARLAMGRIGFVNAPAFFQRVAGGCIDIQVDVDYYDRNRRLLYDTLTRLGFICTKPQGAFYIFVKAPGDNEKRFLDMAEKRHLIFVGGSAFGWEGYARLSFCCSYDVLEAAVPALELLAKDCGMI